MKFNLEMLRNYLLIQHRVSPESVKLDTNFKTQLRMNDEQVKSLLGFVSGHTGVAFPKDASHYLIDVFDLVIHIMVRSGEVDLGEYLSSISEPIWQKFLINKFNIPVYAYLN